ncbi:MAG TPA: hypothetical protein VLT61_17005, partial [Anaeromyxobacteraceae bacterium]|nr:hypothetical protein [Anaeromyxobacteraceae bacterium]
MGTHARAVGLDALLLAALGLVALLAIAVGRSGRVYATAPNATRCASPEEALSVWRERGVRGRVLVHFARSIAMDSEPGPPSRRDYLLHALDEGVVRSVVHVVPDEAWPEVALRLGAMSGALRDGERFQLRKAGVPIVVTRRSDLPRLREPVLVTIEGDLWSQEALADIVTTVHENL